MSNADKAAAAVALRNLTTALKILQWPRIDRERRTDGWLPDL